jgi:hypothetical protein
MKGCRDIFSNTSTFEFPEDTTSQRDLAADMDILSSEALAGHYTKFKLSLAEHRTDIYASVEDHCGRHEGRYSKGSENE